MAYPVKRHEQEKKRARLRVVETHVAKKKGPSPIRKALLKLSFFMAVSLIFGLSALVIARYETIEEKTREISERDASIRQKEGERDYYLQKLAPFTCEKVLEEKASVNLGMVRPNKGQVVHIAMDEVAEKVEENQSWTESLRAFVARIKNDREGV